MIPLVFGIRGILGIPDEKWYASIIGFILLVGFATTFVFVGHTVPPRIVLNRLGIDVGDDRTIEAKNVTGFRIVAMKNWYVFEIDCGNVLEQPSLSFHIAVRPETQSKVEAVKVLLMEIKNVGARNSTNVL